MKVNQNREQWMRQLFAEIAEKQVKPLAAEIDAEERFPEENVAIFAKAGLMGLPFPKEVGGAGATAKEYAICIEEIAKVCATSAVVISAHTSLCCWPIYTFGTAEQKERFLPDLLAGRKIGAFALTEAFAGTDSAAQQTKAEKVEGGYRVNGSKMFITNATHADVFVIFAMTDKAAGNRGITSFILEKGTPGFSIGKPEEKLGIRGSATSELIFKDVFIPDDMVLGQVGRGFKVAMQTLDGGRVGIAAQALGIAAGALQETINYTQERKQFGRSISKFQNTQFVLADMATKVEAARLLVYKAAECEDKKEPYTVPAAMAKLFAAEVAMEVTVKAVQLHGGYGYTREYPVERMMRDAKITEIYEGTSEVQRMVISGNLLK